MPMPTVVGVGALASGANGISPAFPGGYTPVAGDIGCTWLECAATDTVTPPSGWALVINSTVASGTPTKLSVIWRRIQAGDTAPAIADAGNHLVGRMMILRGCVATGNPWNVASQTTELAADTSVSIPGVTTTVANCLLSYGFSTGQDVSSTAGASGWADASLANVTEWMDNWAIAGDGGGFAMASGEKSAAGATGAMTATLALTPNFKTLITIAWQGATGGTTFPASLGGSSTGTGALARRPGKPIGGVSTGGAALNKLSAKAVMGGSTGTAAITRRAARSSDGSSAAAATLMVARTRLLAVAGSIAAAAEAARQVQQLHNGAAAPLGGLSRQLHRPFAGSSAVSAAVLASRTCLLSVTGGASAFGLLARQSRKETAGAADGAGSLVRQVSSGYVGVATAAAAMAAARVRVLTLAGSLVSSGVLQRVVNRRATGTAAASSAATKRPQTGLAGSLSPAGMVWHLWAYILAGRSTPVGSASTEVLTDLVTEGTANGGYRSTFRATAGQQDAPRARTGTRTTYRSA